MGNTTTPLKAVFCGMISAKLVAMLGMDETSASTASLGLWIFLSAGLAYVLPHDAGILARVKEVFS